MKLFSDKELRELRWANPRWWSGWAIDALDNLASDTSQGLALGFTEKEILRDALTRLPRRRHADAERMIRAGLRVLLEHSRVHVTPLGGEVLWLLKIWVRPSWQSEREPDTNGQRTRRSPVSLLSPKLKAWDLMEKHPDWTAARIAEETGLKLSTVKELPEWKRRRLKSEG